MRNAKGNPVINVADLTIVKATKTFVAEASDLNNLASLGGIKGLPKAINVYNPKTGNTATFVFKAATRLHRDNDVVAWIFDPSVITKAAFPETVGWTLEILND